MIRGEYIVPRNIDDEPIVSSHWIEFVKFCSKLQFGRIEKLEIQNGRPVFAETVTEKVKFG